MIWKNTKRKIAENYCRTVLVLDDEIIEKAPRNPDSKSHAPQFIKAKEQFAAKGILCDLRQVDTTANASSDGMRSCLRNSDVVIVDWYLGVDSGNDPKESIEVLEEILKLGGERFVAIHSQETGTKIREYLEGRFTLIAPKKQFRGETEDADVTPVSESEEPTAPTRTTKAENPEVFTLTEKSQDATNASKIHLCILHKRTINETAEMLPNAILAALEQAFPDHLHWVGLEFATRVRGMLPELIRQLPSDMDAALVFQAMVQGPDELADDIAECLCLELRELLRVAPLEAATDSVLIGRLNDRLSAISGTPIKNIPSKWNADLAKTDPAPNIKNWANGENLLKDNAALKNSRFLLEALLETGAGTFDKAHSRYAALREHVHSIRPEKIKLYPGVILSAEESTEGDARWRLCLTPACDCARGGEHEHLFVYGCTSEHPKFANGAGVRTSVLSGKHEVEVKWLVTTFHTERCESTGPQGWKPVTILRDPFVQKIVQALWGQQSRIGVNTSEVLRVLRKEKA